MLRANSSYASMLKPKRRELKGWMAECQWLNGTHTMVHWSQPTHLKPQTLTSGHSLGPRLCYKQQKTFSIGPINQDSYNPDVNSNNSHFPS